MLLWSSVVLFSVLHTTNAFRALYLASNVGYSHIEYTGRLADALVDAGHEVDFVIEVWDPTSKHNGSKKANIIRFEGSHLEKMSKLNEKITVWNDAFTRDMSSDDLVRFGESFAMQCEALLTDHKLLDYLRTRNYTVGLCEGFDGCAPAVFRMLGIKSYHETNAIPLPESTAFSHGIPYDFRHIPVFHNNWHVGPINSFILKLYNFYEYLHVRFRVQHRQYGPTDEVIKRLLGADHPTLAQLQRRASYIWVNTYEFMDFTRLSSPKLKHIGGIAVKEAGPLSKELEAIFQSAKKGVIPVSFGSLVNTAYMRPEMRRLLLDTFARFPDYQFIWRFTELNDEILADVQNHSNVHAFKWVDQRAILADPRTAAFVSHVGLNSLNEAVHFGVPLIAVPFFGDQPMNAGMVMKRGNGVFVSRKNIGMLPGALSEVLNNKKYKERALDLKAKVTNKPFTPEELFVKHVEFAERFDVTEDLELDSVNDSFIEQINLDILGLVLVLAVVSGLLLYIFLRLLFTCFIVVLHLLNRYSVLSKTKKLD